MSVSSAQIRRFGLNGSTTGSADLLTDLAAARDAGFAALELRDVKVQSYLDGGGTLGELADTFALAGVLPLSVNALERATPSVGSERSAVLQRCRVLCEWAQAIGSPYVVAVPGPAEGGDLAEMRDASVEALRALGAIGRDLGVGIGFEFLGFADCSVRTVAAAREILDAVGDPGVGLVVDAFHYYVGGSTPEMLRGLDPRSLFIVHLDDAEDRPREVLTDAHRLLPGEGILPLHELLSALDALSYDGFFSVELFRPEYWAWNPHDLARAARQSLEAVFAGEQRLRYR